MEAKDIPTEDLREMLFLQEKTSFEWPLGEWPSPIEIRKELERRKD
jgi:hypothetical protein